MEQIDHYQVYAWDGVTPLEESLRFLDDAVRSGKIAYYGFSNFLGWQLTKAVYVARACGFTPPVTLQPQYSQLAANLGAAAALLTPGETDRLTVVSAPVVADYPYGQAGVDQRRRAVSVDS